MGFFSVDFDEVFEYTEGSEFDALKLKCEYNLISSIKTSPGSIHPLYRGAS